MESAEDRARAIFGERAAFYTTSTTHSDPRVLQRVVELARPQSHWNVLDIGTGTGHTAFSFAPHVRSVTGIDLTGQMLAEAERLRKNKALSNVTFEIGDAHLLPHGDKCFDLVTCRRAAHHFSNIRQALGESLTRDVSKDDERKIHSTLNNLTASQKAAFNLVEQNGELYLNHWYVLISAQAR